MATSGSGGVLNRAVAASTALVVGAVAVTGVFVAKIARSYAAPGSNSGNTGSVDQQGNQSGDDGNFFGGTGGTGGSGSVSQPQQNQQPAGSSHGS